MINPIKDKVCSECGLSMHSKEAQFYDSTDNKWKHDRWDVCIARLKLKLSELEQYSDWAAPQIENPPRPVEANEVIRLKHALWHILIGGHTIPKGTDYAEYLARHAKEAIGDWWPGTEAPPAPNTGDK